MSETWSGGIFVRAGLMGRGESLPCRTWQARPTNPVKKKGGELCLDCARPCYKGLEEVSVAEEI